MASQEYFRRIKMGDEQLIRLLNSFTPSQYADFLSRSPVTLDYVNKIGYQHPSVMKSNQAYAMQNQSVTSNLGMSGPTMQNAYPTAPDTGFKMPLTTTPQAESTGFKGYPYSRPNDMSIDAMSSDPNYGQFYSRMRNDYNVANTSLPTGSSGMPSVDLASQSARQQASDQAVADSISGADAGGMSNLQSAGMYYGANVATDALINTHDRKKVDTPFGNKGSMGGITKGGVKGALLGAQLSGGNPYATAGGAVVGALAGTQGGFDTNTPPSYQVVGVRRRGGGGGLLAPKGMYG